MRQKDSGFFWAKRLAAAARFWRTRISMAFRFYLGVFWRIAAWNLSPKQILLRTLSRPGSKRFLLSVQSKMPNPLRQILLNLYFRAYSNPLRDQTAEHVEVLPGQEVGSRGLQEVNTKGEFFAPTHWPDPKESIGLIVLPVIDWRFRWQRPQQMATSLSNMGVDVKYVSPRFTRTSGRYFPLASRVQEWVLPGRASLNIYQDRLSTSDVEKSLRFIKARLNEAVYRSWAVVVQHPFWEPLAAEMRSHLGMPLIFDCMDENAGFSNSGENVREMELSLASKSDLVVCTSERIRESVNQFTQNALIIRNGADFDHFAKVSSLDRNANKTVGYYGAIADWFDSEFLARVAEQMPEVKFELIGSFFSANLTPLAPLPNVTFFGEIPYLDLPQAISRWDCCIIPFKINSLTLATNPVKLYEMLAAGKPVVAIPLPELQVPELKNLISIADTPGAFSAAIYASISQNNEEQIKSRQDFALQNTWNSRAENFLTSVRALFPKLSVIVVTYNNLALNRLCIESVLSSSYPNIELIIVDNNSTDGSVQYLDSIRDPRVLLIKNQSNAGYASANNQGIKKSTGEFIVLLNNDTVCPPFLLDQLVTHLKNNPNLGLVGPVTNAIGNEARIPVSYFNLADLAEWSELVWNRSNRELTDIDMLAFFCVAFRRETLEQVGYLDEQFGIGMYEDDDYCRRVREAGLDVKLATDTFVHHWHHASFKLLGEELFLDLISTNKDKFENKWGPGREAVN